MSISSIDLNNSELVELAMGGKSPAFFCKKFPIKVKRDLLRELEKMSTDLDENVRLCMHTSPDSPFHDMLIVERQGKYYPPHKHLTKGESFHIIEGQLAVFSFDDSGNIIDSCVLTNSEHFIYKVGVDMFHAVMPMSDVVVYHESKPGPFLGDKDSITPDWAPDTDNPEEVQKFQERLVKSLEI